MKKKSFSVSEFKAKSLGLLEEVSRTGESLTVTKRGKAIAKVVPFTGASMKAEPDRLRDMLVAEEDILTPLGSGLWEAAEGSPNAAPDDPAEPGKR